MVVVWWRPILQLTTKAFLWPSLESVAPPACLPAWLANHVRERQLLSWRHTVEPVLVQGCDVSDDCYSMYSLRMNTTLMQSSLVLWSASEPSKRSPSLSTMTSGLGVERLHLTGGASSGRVALYFPQQQQAVLIVHHWLAPLLKVLQAKNPSSWVLR